MRPFRLGLELNIRTLMLRLPAATFLNDLDARIQGVMPLTAWKFKELRNGRTDIQLDAQDIELFASSLLREAIRAMGSIEAPLYFGHRWICQARGKVDLDAAIQEAEEAMKGQEGGS